MPTTEARLDFPAGGAEIRAHGDWTLTGIATLEQRLAAMPWPTAAALTLDASAIAAMDTAGAWLLRHILNLLNGTGHRVSLHGLRAAHSALLQMIEAAPPAPARPPAPPGLLAAVGRNVWRGLTQGAAMLTFIGENTLAALTLLRHPKRIRWRAVLHNLQNDGFNALPITGLLAFLMGIVIAYQGAEQLRRYGANIFVVDLVGLSMLRELGPLLTAIIVAGRSGSAYAAQIGTMQVTEEIDAMQTIGIAPLDLLVLPKVIALMIALPLLTVFADILGVLGGMVMAQSQLGVGHLEFITRFASAVKLSSYLVGIGKAPVFAFIIAIVGCFQGFQVRGGADSVGRQTTISVVQAIFLVIVADALFSILFSWLKI